MFLLLSLMGLASAAWTQPQLKAEQPLSIMPVQVNACWGETPVGLIPLEGDTKISSVEFYDLADHRLSAATGICICRTLLSRSFVNEILIIEN